MNETVLEAKNIWKSFGGTKALKGVDFELKKGEIHGLIGENGAGKSTLIKIIAGYYHKDDGELRINGQTEIINKPADSLHLGIRVISQEFNLMNDLTVAENICVGDYPCYQKTGLINWKQLNKNAQKLLDGIGENIQATAYIRSLTVAEQQTVEIAKALWKQPKILIMDEPTAALNDQETEHLFILLRRLKAQGVSIIFITHRLQEQFVLSDRVTVMRDGNVIGTLNIQEATEDLLAEMMVGRNISANYERSASHIGDVIYEARKVFAGNRLKDINFKVHRGEIVSIFGLLGQGQDYLTRVLIGDVKLESGEIWVKGERTHLRSPQDAVRHGIGFVSEDRKKAGLLLLQNVERNISVASLDKVSRLGVIRSKAEKDLVTEWVEKLRIKCSSIFQPISGLSGGNQQKCLIARWLANNSEFIILNLPTRGVDIGAKYDIYQILEGLCRAGVGVLIFSLELPEILGVSDRIYIMRDGRIVNEYINNKSLTSETIMASAVGQINKQEDLQGVSG